MQFGLGLPTGGAVAGTDAIARVAEGAEQIGLGSLWTFERQLAPTGEVAMGGMTMQLPDFYETVYAPLEVLAYVAARTTRIRLGTSVIVALFHHPAALARSFATLDQLSNGRVVAGLGQGWMREEFEAAGVPMSRRGAGFGEFIEAMRAAWEPDPVSFDGRFYRVPESRMNPKPVQDGGPPIFAAASTPAAIQRVARLGLGLNALWYGSWEALEGVVQAFRAAAREAGREPDELPVIVRVNEPLTEAPSGTEPSLVGSPEQVAEAVPRLERLGISEVFWSMLIPADQQLGLMTRLVDAVGSKS